ncbi:MAG: hypothetical protein KatS3mg096_642 [Candidatus Parcubacteria bacterium]|nr:MAG: hypothetical protein KatS3mg096_642 [Candidatus Parcubacteria bacterium]
MIDAILLKKTDKYYIIYVYGLTQENEFVSSIIRIQKEGVYVSELLQYKYRINLPKYMLSELYPFTRIAKYRHSVKKKWISVI